MTLIDAARAASLPDAGLVILDVRWSLADGADSAAYRQGHIPTAVFADLPAELCGPAGSGGRHPLPAPHVLQERLRAWGVDDDSVVLVYDGGDMMAAARTWWTLRWAGLDEVYVLDGGLPAWVRHGGIVTTEEAQPVAGNVTVNPDQMPTLDAKGAAAVAAAGKLRDVREPQRYTGEAEPIDPVAGHIPGARNLPGSAVMSEAGGFADLTQLRQHFSGCDADTGVYCGSGVTAARSALAMESATGLTPAVYIGSWSDWIVSGDGRVATGDS